MTVDKFSEVWGEDGNTGTAPDAEKISQGNVRGEKPSWQRDNWKQNRSEKKINEIITEGPSTLYDASTDHKFMVASGLFTESWASGDDPVNRIDGTNKEYSSLVVNIDIDGKPFLIAASDFLSKFERWDARSVTLGTTSGLYTDDLPATAGSWSLHSICTNNVNIFGLFSESGTDTWRVQSWSATDLVVNPDWPATGIALSGTGAISTASSNSPTIKIADSTHLVTGNSWVTVTSSASAAISILNISNGTIIASGAGDAPTGDSVESGRAIGTDGTNIFFGAFGSANYLCSATIADPTAGTGGTGYPLTVDDGIRDICSMGVNMWVAKDSASGTATDTIGITCNATAAAMHEVVLGTDSTGTVSADTIMQQPYKCVFDGINIWTIGSMAATFDAVLVKMDAGRLWRMAAVSDIGQPDIIAGVYPLDPDTSAVGFTFKGAMCFDGRDVWCIHDKNTTGAIIRIPLASMRS